MSAIAAADVRFVRHAHLPFDVKPTCTADIAPWFNSGIVTANGRVSPANSLNPIFADFKHNTRCDFYKWGARMFLWLTSGKRQHRVFNTTPEFYNVSDENNGKRVFLNVDGLRVLGVRKSKTDKDVELGQAGGGEVLLSQKGSLIYYGIHTDDIYALYATGLANKKTRDKLPDHFPSTLREVEAVKQFARSYGYHISDLKPMVMEIKTAWVEASTVANPSDYIVSHAMVPVYDRSKPKGPWPAIGSARKALALVGMHIVATVDGHPEMIWTTFEHVDNAPDNRYAYLSTDGKVKSHAYNSAGRWNFIHSNAEMPTAITANARADTKNSNSSFTESIVNIDDADIAPINVLRVNPWGNSQTNSCGIITETNTDLASINKSVLSQLKRGDQRGHYIQVGGLWTAEGQIPRGFPTTAPSYLRGSLNLANTALETYYQFYNNSSSFNPVNCFGCHGGVHGATTANPVTDPTFVSHIFEAMQPLPGIKEH